MQFDNYGLSCPAKAGHPVIATAGFVLKRRRLLGRPPEPVIGPAEGRTRWRTMTAESHHAESPSSGATLLQAGSTNQPRRRASCVKALSCSTTAWISAYSTMGRS